MKFPIQMYDPTRDYQNHKIDFDEKILKVIKEGFFIGGPEVKELEKLLQDYTEAKHAITCANGTDAIFIALLSLGIGNGDEVITVAHTWISTSETIALTGATPVFVDINEHNFNIDINKIEERITDKTKAILFVSLYGLMPDCEMLQKIAQKYHIALIEDGAQSFGAEFKGTKSCSCHYTDIATTSFFPSKPLGCWGDGGSIFTNNDELAMKIRAIKSHGGIERFKHKYIGLNSRLDTIQAAVLTIKMKYLEETIMKRNQCAHYYTDKLKNLEQLKKPTYNSSSYRHVWAQYSLLCQNKLIRDNLVDYLKKNNVNVAIFYPVGLHKQECFQYLNVKSLEVTDQICDTIINLPCYAEITKEEQDYIINLLYQFFKA